MAWRSTPRPRHRGLRLKFPSGARHLQLLSPHMDAMRGIAMFADCGKEFQEMLNSRWALEKEAWCARRIRAEDGKGRQCTA